MECSACVDDVAKHSEKEGKKLDESNDRKKETGLTIGPNHFDA